MNKRGKLDNLIVADIKALSNIYSDSEIAKYFNLSKSIVRGIREGKYYKYVKESTNCDIKLKNKRKLTDYWVNVFRQFSKQLDVRKVIKETNISESLYYSVISGSIYKDVLYIPIPEERVVYLFKELKHKLKREGRYVVMPNKTVNEKGSGVYIIRNITNNLVYVGSSVEILKRLNWHYNTLHSNKHPNKILQNSVNKYGLENFEFIPVVNCPPEYNTILEQWFKDKSNFTSYFNIAKDCSAPALGTTLTQEARRKISDRNKGHKWTTEQKERLSSILKNKLRDKEEKLKRLKNLGKKRIGEQSGVSKISDNERLEIIEKINKGIRPKDIAKDYNITAGMVSEVKNGRAWRHLTHLIK